MKIKPVVSESIYTVHTNYVVNLKLESNVTFISGDSGTGKSAMYSFVEELSSEDKRIRCFNYLDINKRYDSSIKKLRGKIIVIDNADILLNDELRSYIALDDKNQYIIIGRNPFGLMLMMDEIYELESTNEDEKTIFKLKKKF